MRSTQWTSFREMYNVIVHVIPALFISRSFQTFTFISFFPKSPSFYPPGALSKAGHRPKVIQYPRAEENSISTLCQKSISRAEKLSGKNYFSGPEMFRKKVFLGPRNVQ